MSEGKNTQKEHGKLKNKQINLISISKYHKPINLGVLTYISICHDQSGHLGKVNIVLFGWEIPTRHPTIPSDHIPSAKCSVFYICP